MLLSLLLNGGAGPESTSLATEATEAFATLREVVLMRHDLGSVIPPAAPGDDVVVLVHGFCASAGVFRPLRQELEAQSGVFTASFSHLPGQGVRAIARHLARLVDRIPRSSRVHIVGHSLGGVVARWYVQELGGHTSVQQTISLGSPFGGTAVAKAFPVLIGKDLHPNSELLTRLRKGAMHSTTPHTSFVAGQDRMVWPRESAVLPAGDVITLEGRGHNSLLYDAAVCAHLVTLIKRPLGAPSWESAE
jgi:triacylglycerol lipase